MSEFLKQEVDYLVLGNVGSDAGYWVFRNGHWEHVGGWGVDSILEVQAGLAVLAAASRLKTPGLAERIGSIVHEAIGAELAEHTGGAGVVVVAA